MSHSQSPTPRCLVSNSFFESRQLHTHLAKPPVRQHTPITSATHRAYRESVGYALRVKYNHHQRSTFTANQDTLHRHTVPERRPQKKLLDPHGERSLGQKWHCGQRSSVKSKVQHEASFRKTINLDSKKKYQWSAMKLVNPQWLPVGQMEKAVTWPCSAVPCRVTDVRFRASAVHFLAYCVA